MGENESGLWYDLPLMLFKDKCSANLFSSPRGKGMHRSLLLSSCVSRHTNMCRRCYCGGINRSPVLVNQGSAGEKKFAKNTKGNAE